MYYTSKVIIFISHHMINQVYLRKYRKCSIVTTKTSTTFPYSTKTGTTTSSSQWACSLCICVLQLSRILDISRKTIGERNHKGCRSYYAMGQERPRFTTRLGWVWSYPLGSEYWSGGCYMFGSERWNIFQWATFAEIDFGNSIFKHVSISC